MTNLVTRAQVILLARTLQVPPERLAHLERLGAVALHEIQERMAGIIFEQHKETFKRISRLVPLIPLNVSMPLVQRIIPPAITGRAAGTVGVDHPKKAAETIALLGTSYAADSAAYMDPATLGQLADVAPAAPLIRIVNEILRRHDYVTLAPFLAHATPSLIAALEQGARDDAGLIHAASYAYSAESVGAIMRQLVSGPAQRIPRMVRTVLAGPPDLQLAALSVFARCEPEVIRTIGDILFAVGSPPAIGNLITGAIRVGAVPEMLVLAGNLSRQSLGKMAANPAFDNYDTMDAIVAALRGHSEPNCWRGFFALAARTGTDVQRRTARLLAGLPDAIVIDLPTRATEADMWPMLLQLIAVADPTVQDRFGTAWATLSAERRAGLQWHIHEHHLDARLSAITEAAPTMSVEEVFYQRRKSRRHLGAADSPADNWNPW
ncbi:hypothetical protein KO481_35880 [Nocardia sp. NEAU-G5]|uniref:Uncharacterized protein n=1 Tax=Nocardia albiluteola TaxID=2842303 RepID=A0ABS6B9B2_9NOCA|nr:hypothetical protein [Nocardia albiluteola]MBU3066888.1 hypothetical protein [Nocardia albiluteola]